MELRFGKYKGQKVEDIAKHEEGRGYLEWLSTQPTEGKYKEANDKRNAYIQKILSGHKPATKPQAKEINFNAVVLSKLDQIIGLLNPNEVKGRQVPDADETIQNVKEVMHAQEDGWDAL